MASIIKALARRPLDMFKNYKDSSIVWTEISAIISLNS